MVSKPPPLDQAEYIEQAYLFQLLAERIADQVPMQELLEQLQHELLATTKLPMAIDFLLTELKHSGLMAPAMHRLGHYFAPFQTYLIEESELEAGRFGIEVALQILRADARYRGEQSSPAGFFLFQFEVLSRNRLNYDRGLTAISNDPVYDLDWSKWILMLRAEIGLIDLADLLFLASEEYRRRLEEARQPTEGKGPFLFGQKEGRIALANRRKDPIYLFGAMQRHLGYPAVPRPKPTDTAAELLPQLARRMERLETRMKLLEQDQKQNLDITKFYQRPDREF